MSFSSILSFDLPSAKLLWLDLTKNNLELSHLNPDNTREFTEYVFNKIKNAQADLGIGGWLEDRFIYSSREQFNKGKSRNIHLGVDIWMPAGTPLFCPTQCEVHSFANNLGFGNYGPTIILKAENTELYFLYGHLSLESLHDIEVGQKIESGKKVAEIGNFPINGDWPPHLHFQVMNNMLGKEGDFPGVCAASELKVMQKFCLNPYPFLGFDEKPIT